MATPHTSPPARNSVFWLPAVAGVCALLLYALCLAPGLTWAHDGADGGDLLAAALTHGVPHPTGYPTYQIVLRAAIALFPGEPARAGNWLSAGCAAAATVLVADLMLRMLPHRPWRGPIALSAALTWAVSPTLWSQAVITEVYTLHALLLSALLWLLWRWRELASAGRAAWPCLAAGGFVIGIGMGSHLSMVLVWPGVIVWLVANRRLLAPIHTAGWAAIAGAALLGTASFLYLPAAASGNPAVNWGDPKTVPQLWWLVSGQTYRPLVFGIGLRDLPGRASAWAAQASNQFGGGPWGALIALAGLFWLDRHDHAWWRATLLVGLAFSVYAIGYGTRDSYIYLIPVWIVAALWLAAGLAWGAEAIIGTKHQQRTRRLLWVPLLAVLAALPALSTARHWQAMDLSREHEARDWTVDALASAAPDSLLLTSGDRTTFALWYALYGLKLRPDLTPVNVSLYAYPWYQRTLVSHHPVLAGYAHDGRLPPLEQLIGDAGKDRPIYRVEPIDLDGTIATERSAGALIQIEPK